MDESRYLLRKFTDADFEANSRVLTRVNPDDPISAEQIRHWDRLDTASGRTSFNIVVEDRFSRAAVGFGSLFQPPTAFHPDKYWVVVAVDPDHQRRGVGRRLFTATEEVAVSRGATTLFAGVRAAQERSVRFFERSGFVERRRTWLSRLDLASVPRAGPGPRAADAPVPGIELTTAAQEGSNRADVRERVYRLYTESEKDVPRMSEGAPATYEQFIEMIFGGPGYFPEGVFLARAGGDYVAMTTLTHNSTKPDTLNIGFTGTLPSHRGKGIASELKRIAIEFARDQGYRFVQTYNDSLNDRIWSINERLGFRQLQVVINGEKALAPTA